MYIQANGKLPSPVHDGQKMTPVGFEPTQLALVELESTPLDHSGKVSMQALNNIVTRKASHSRPLPPVSGTIY